jgi:flagellar motor switch protein FliN/FliY
MSDKGQAVEEQQNGQMDSSRPGNAEAKGENPEEQTDTRTQVQSVEFSEAVATEVAGPTGSIDILLDMKVPVTVTIGQTELPVQRFLRLGQGSVLKLDKSVDEPVELYLRDTKFATGSVVVVDGRFAVKIKQILNPATPKLN